MQPIYTATLYTPAGPIDGCLGTATSTSPSTLVTFLGTKLAQHTLAPSVRCVVPFDACDELYAPIVVADAHEAVAWLAARQERRPEDELAGALFYGLEGELLATATVWLDEAEDTELEAAEALGVAV